MYEMYDAGMNFPHQFLKAMRRIGGVNYYTKFCDPVEGPPLIRKAYQEAKDEVANAKNIEGLEGKG